MKKQLLVLAVTFFAISGISHAQIDKGQIMLGIDLGVSSSKEEQALGTSGNSEYTVTSFTINPQIGFGLGNNLIAGFGVGYSSTTAKDKISSGSLSAEDEEKLTMFAVDAFLRKFHKFSESAGIFGELGVAYGSGKEEFTPSGGTTTESDVTMISAGISPGLYFKPSSRFIVEATFGRLGYTSTKLEEPGEPDWTRNEFELNLTRSMTLGLKFILK